MRATKYTYSIQGNIIAIIDSLAEDTLPLVNAIEDVIAEISDKEKLDSRVYCWIYFNNDPDINIWDGYSPCTHTFFDVGYPVIDTEDKLYPSAEEQLVEALKSKALLQKAHFLANNPMIMLEKAYYLNTSEEARNHMEFFKIDSHRSHKIKEEISLLGYKHTNKEMGRAEFFNRASQIAQSANELAYIVIYLYGIAIPAGQLANAVVKEEINKQTEQN